MNNEKYHELLQRAASQHGVFCRREAKDLGVPRSTLASAIESGRLMSPYPGTYVVMGSPDTQLQRIAVAVLSIPGLAAVSHDTAAELWGMTRRGIRAIHVVTPRWDRAERPGIVVHESLDLVPGDVLVSDGIAMTSPERTVVDLGATNRWIVESALEEGIRRELFTLLEVERFVDRVRRRGRRGVGVIRPLLEERRRWDTATESVLEDLFRKTVARLGLPAPEEQYTLRDASGLFICRADFAYPRFRLLIELDSEAHHMDRMTFRGDRAKQNQAAAVGWTVLRFTWWDLRDGPHRIVAQIKAIMAAHQPG
jgi:very-short-patch-repair endonuclease